MPTFKYRAKISPSETVDGVIAAPDRDNAVNQIIRLGYTPLTVTVSGKNSENLLQKEILSAECRRILFQELADLLGAGVPLLRALQVIGERKDDPRLTRVIQAVIENVQGGQSFHESLADFVPAFHLNLIRSGELSGRLDISLQRLSVFENNSQELQRQIFRSLLYPVIVLLTGILAVTILVLFVVPRLIVLFEDFGGALPLPTRLLIFICNKGPQLSALMMLGLGLGVWFVLRIRKSPELRKSVDKVLLRVPVFGSFFADVIRERFCRSLAVLLKSGVMIVPALNTSARLVQNHFMKAKIDAIARRVTGGQNLRSAAGEEALFPASALSKIAAGEESGRLSEVLEEMADSYERRILHLLKTGVALLEPVLVLVMGAAVGFIAVAMLLPIFRMNLIVQ